MGDFFYVIVSFLIDFLVANTRFGQENKHSITGVFTILEFLTLAIFFQLSYNSGKIKKLSIIITLIVFSFLLANFIKSDRREFDSTSASMESITLIIFSIIYFFEEINKPQPYFIFSSSNFWIVLGILIYMSSTLFLFIIVNNLSPEERDKYWTINTVSSILTNIIFCIGFIRNKYAHSSPSLENSSL